MDGLANRLISCMISYGYISVPSQDSGSIDKNAAVGFFYLKGSSGRKDPGVHRRDSQVFCINSKFSLIKSDKYCGESMMVENQARELSPGLKEKGFKEVVERPLSRGFGG